MKNKNIILPALSIIFIISSYSSNSFAELLCFDSGCFISSGETLDEETYKAADHYNYHRFTGERRLHISVDGQNPLKETLSKITIKGLAYYKFDVDANYSKDNPYKMALNTPSFYMETPTKDSLLKNSIFLGYYPDFTLENSTIENAIFFANKKGVLDNKVINGQILISNRYFMKYGYFAEDDYPFTNTEVKKTEYYNNSSEIIISDSNDNLNISSSDSTFYNTSE